MRRLLLLLAFAATPALAAADRAVYEDGSNGATSEYSLATTTFRAVWDNGSTTLVPHTCAANSCTRAAPSAATEGMVLTGIGSYQVWACVSTGTFDGTGAVKLYVYDPSGASGAQWGYVLGKDKTPSASASGCVMLVQDKNSFGASESRLVARSVSVGTSAAAPTLTIKLLGCKKSFGCFTAALERARPSRYARSWRPPAPSWSPVAFPLPERRRSVELRA